MISSMLAKNMHMATAKDDDDYTRYFYMPKKMIKQEISLPKAKVTKRGKFWQGHVTVLSHVIRTLVS